MNNVIVTSGVIESRITHPSVRATLDGSDGGSAGMSFVYRGSTVDTIPLGSGQIREQVGLRLRAQNACNCVYVMWRWEPGEPMIEVSVKHNPGQSQSSECGSAGYTKIEPALFTAVGQPIVDQHYTLRASAIGPFVHVWLDGGSVESMVWCGELTEAGALMRGAAGFRTDNTALDELEFWDGR